MFSTPCPMKKISLYMVDADAQRAALTLARRAERKMLESGQGLHDWDVVDERTPELIERG